MRRISPAVWPSAAHAGQHLESFYSIDACPVGVQAALHIYLEEHNRNAPLSSALPPSGSNAGGCDSGGAAGGSDLGGAAGAAPALPGAGGPAAGTGI